MPELPEVEVWRRHLEDRGLERPVREVEVRDADTLRQCLAPDEAADLLLGRHFTEARRHGKHLFVGLSGDGGWLRLHFGMSGYLRFLDSGEEWPEHAVLRLTFEDGGRLAYVNVRKLGQVDRADSVEGFVDEHGLGPDPLADGMDLAGFRRALEGRRGMVKSALMNQEILAGLGNEYVDEILLDAGIHPRRSVSDLDDEAVAGLYRAMGRVVDGALEALEPLPEGEVDPDRFPEEFLLPHREEGAACPRCGGTIERVEVSGRSAYVCPDHQR